MTPLFSAPDLGIHISLSRILQLLLLGLSLLIVKFAVLLDEQKCRHSDVRSPAHNTLQSFLLELSSSYLYQSLDHVLGQQIRVVELLPGHMEDDLRCNITHTNLASPTHDKYRAISYAWAKEDGNIKISEIIYCGPNCLILLIFPKYANVLRRIQRPNVKQVLWTDMICIDQDSTEERNHQVALMSTIYSKAYQVVAYLGEPDASSDRIFGHLSDPISGFFSLVVRDRR
jgi:hypothetical protein